MKSALTLLTAGALLLPIGLLNAGCSDSGDPAFSAVIDELGGAVEYPERGRLEVPAGALDRAVEIEISLARSRDLAEPPRGLEHVREPIVVKPHGTEFATPARIRVDVTPAPSRMRMYTLDDEQDTEWKLVRSETVDGGAVRARVDHISVFAVFTATEAGDCTTLDDDGDGVGDLCDVCDGFDDALDSDGDGVPDGCDRCPDEDDSTALPGCVVRRRLSVGLNLACVLDAQAMPHCWGEQENGEAYAAEAAAATIDFVEYRVGESYMCGLDVSGQVHCWGANDLGQTTGPTGLGEVTTMDAGRGHACAIDVTGAVDCWGDDSLGQATVDPTLGPAKIVAAGLNHTCAVEVDGDVVCWGSNAQLQLDVPPGLSNVRRLDVARHHGCAVDASGAVTCWGDDTYGQASPPALSDAVDVRCGSINSMALTSTGQAVYWGDMSNTAVPIGINDAVEMDHSGWGGCALLTTDEIRCWGGNGSGIHAVPRTPGAISAIAIGRASTPDGPNICAVNQDGDVQCWGPASRDTIVEPFAAGNVLQLSAGDNYVCVVDDTNSLACYGGNQNGRSSPPPLGTVTQVSAGYAHACALEDTGAVSCWGLDNYLQASPPTMPPLGTLVDVSAATFHSCAVDDAGLVTCWGDDGYGRATPIALGIVVDVEANRESTCAFNDMGVVGCWGRSNVGQLAGPISLGPVVELVGGGRLGQDFYCARDNVGAVECWGANGAGQASPPATLPASVGIAAGVRHACSLDATGALTCWGSDRHFDTRVPVTPVL